MKHQRRRKFDNIEIQVTNLVDIIFVLLIFFILTTTFTKDTGLEITKPKASSATQIAAKNLQVSVTRDGLYYLDDRQVDLALMQTIIRRSVSKNPDITAVIISDKNAPVDAVLSVLDVCNMVGVKKTSVQAEKS